jgi:type VI secretion system protein VasG
MNRERLFSKLGPTCYDALVDATALGRSKQHTFVDLDHWALCLLQRDASDLSHLLRELGCDVGAVEQRLKKVLERMRVTGDSLRDLAPVLEQCVGPAITWSQIAVPSRQVRSGHLVLSWLDEAATGRWLQQLTGLESDRLALAKVVALFEAQAHLWPEATHTDHVGQISGMQKPLGQADQASTTDALARWATNLTELAAQGELDPVVGRHNELRMVIDVLLRRRQNNPILVGEAGVGKTAVVEGLAQLIQRGHVPEVLKQAQVWSLDIIRMQAGASARGEFEQRLRTVIEAVAASVCPIILFCDEAHTLMGAGGAAGTGDAVNLIKPMLARGQLRMVAATTWSEYKQFIEPDAALTRRFQTVVIDEPSDASAVDMLRIIAPRFGQHHGVQIADAALAAAVQLSRRYLPTRQLPDKAISLLDTACARVAMSQSCTPAALEDLHHQALTLAHALQWRSSDRRLGLATDADDALLAQQQALQTQVSEVTQSFDRQRKDVAAWLEDIQTSSEAEPSHVAPNAWLNKSNTWVKPWVDAQAIAQVISEWTGVPCNDLAQDDADRWLHLADSLMQRIHGQEPAVRSIAKALQVSRSGLNDPARPLGVMLLAGPTGTGKSQTATALAALLFGGERHLIQFNMNEFQEAHTVSTLKGAPPGYVGYGKGGRLTEAVRQKPYSVLLLDEFDRAHPDIHEIFYQVFDKGWMEDGEGRRVSFRNCLILLTTNLGDEDIIRACGQDPAITQPELEALVHQRLQKTFAPPLLGRMQVVAYRPLSSDALTHIAHEALSELGGRLRAQSIDWLVEPQVAPWIAKAVANHPSSARAVGDLLRQHVVPHIARGVLLAQSGASALGAVTVSIQDAHISLAFEPRCETTGVLACA